MAGWQTIDNAPKDGRLVLLLTAADPPRINLGKWWPEGTSWVDENGLLGGDCYTLAETGVWESGGGWFQPNEVTHWAAVPEISSGRSMTAQPGNQNDNLS